VDTCAPHREYLGAVADGETALVPPVTLEHVSTCDVCRREIRTHRLLSSKLREAGDQLQAATPARGLTAREPARLRAIGAAFAALVLLGAGGAAWFALSRPDPVEAAMNAASRPLQVESNDPGQVAQWCKQASGRNLPAVQIDGMQVTGARMDRVASTDIVTVGYTAPSGERVTVAWLEGQVPSGTGVEDRRLSGHELLIVHSRVGTAVITGSSAEAMWQTAAAIESATT
jgi:hypothetical protein